MDRLLADIMERADMWMREAGDGFCLTLEPSTTIRIAGDEIGKHFDRDGAIQAGIAGFVDFAHSSGAR